MDDISIEHFPALRELADRRGARVTRIAYLGNEHYRVEFEEGGVQATFSAKRDELDDIRGGRWADISRRMGRSLEEVRAGLTA